MKPRIGVVIPTLNSSIHLEKCLTPLLKSRLKPQILVIDSSSKDDSVAIARKMGVRVIVIPQKEFNHGLTREKGRCELDVDIVVMMTPDAYAENDTLIETLIEPIAQGQAAVSYARQKPHPGSSFFASFPREFNYPAQSHIRNKNDASKYGAYLFFCSNSCAAYDMRALDSIGGFQPVLLGEDTLATAQLLEKGHSIAYVAEAVVYHSHQYTLKQEFRRYFDTGLAREQYREYIGNAMQDQSRGKALVKTMLQRLWVEKPTLIPYAIVSSGVKWLGYKMGQKSLNTPSWWKRLFGIVS